MTAEALSLDAGLARDTVGRWIRGTTVPTLAALQRVEGVLSGRLGYPVDLSAAVQERRSVRQRRRSPTKSVGDSKRQVPPLLRSLAELDPFDLEVHRSIEAEVYVQLPALPRYVPRDHDVQLRRVVREAAEGVEPAGGAGGRILDREDPCVLGGAGDSAATGSGVAAMAPD